MAKCVYCKKNAVTEDAIGLPTCKDHESGADEYFEKQTGRKPNQDSYLYCNEHGDMWKPDCLRCEECSQFHYGHNVTKLLARFNSGELGLKIYKIGD